MKLGRMAKSAASTVNTRRREKGLLPRPVTQLICFASCQFFFVLELFHKKRYTVQLGYDIIEVMFACIPSEL